MNNSLISVIVPIYNIEDYLPKCVESIINQTYSNLQIILVDDGATDSSGEICDRYAEKDSRIQVIHQRNGGLVQARKSGLKIATGEYTGFVDGDDYIESTFYEHLIKALEASSADFVHSGFVQEGNNSSRVYAPSYLHVITESENKIELIRNHVVLTGQEKDIWAPAIWVKLFKTDFIKNCFLSIPDKQTYGEDLLAFCRCILESKKFILKPGAEYHYLIRNGSISHKWSVNRFWQESSLYNELCNIWREYGYYEQMMNHMNKYLYLRMVNCMNQVNQIGLGVVKYVIPNMSDFNGKRLIVYGAGTVGKNYISQILAQPQCALVAWIDKKFRNNNQGICVSREQLKNLQYDLIVIAVENMLTAEEIKCELMAIGIEEDKLRWIEPEMINLVSIGEEL